MSDNAMPDPGPLMQLSSGLFAAKTLTSAVELGVFALIDSKGPITAAEFAAALGLKERPAGMLLSGCASLGLLTKESDRFANAPVAAAYLVPGARYWFGDYLSYLDAHVYPGWMQLSRALRHDVPTTWDPTTQASLFNPENPYMVGSFWRAMHSLSVYTARALAASYDFSRVHSLLDVGGGGAAYAIELCLAHPHLRATVYDLPFVCEQTQERVTAAGLSDRITCVPGDFFADEALPGGHDLALLTSVLHDWSEEENRRLLAKVTAALPAGGKVLVAELLMDDDESGPPPAAMFNLLMLVETERGRNYTGEAYTCWLRDAGCAEVERVAVHGISANGVIVGTVG